MTVPELPKIVTPEYSTTLISQSKPVRYRPYLVKEEKVFLTAKESGDPVEIEQAVQQILNACTFSSINIADLPSFDLEYLFLQVRAKSVNNVVNLQYRCENILPDGTTCGATTGVTIDLNEVKVYVDPDHSRIVRISDELTLVFKYPGVGHVAKLLTQPGAPIIGISTNILASCIESITNESGSVYPASDYSAEALVEFVESMSLAQLEKCRQFFDTMPVLRHSAEFQCAKCQYSETLSFEGLADFFG